MLFDLSSASYYFNYARSDNFNEPFLAWFSRLLGTWVSSLVFSFLLFRDNNDNSRQP